MGLFDKVFKSDKKKSRKKAEEKRPGFTPVVVTTDDVAKTLQETAVKHNISSNLLDIRLIDYRSLIKMDTKDKDWIEMEEDDWVKLNKPEILLNPNFEVKQTYEIEILRYKEEPWMSDLLLHMGSNKERNRVVCTIKAGSIVRYVDELEKKIKLLIQKKMLRSHLLINLWDVDYRNVLDEIVAKARVQDQYIVPEDITFDVAVCYASQPSVDDELIFHYKKKLEVPDEKDRMDYSKRGFIQAVEKGEVIIEYIKPQQGKPGRNCQGKYIPIEEPNETNKPDFKTSENIEVEETDKHILYRAKRGGYVVFHDNTYDIKEEMELEEVSFKKTGSIDAGVETEVKLHINERDIMKDAIGTGVEVEATEVRVEGNVGSSAVVKAEEVVIGGQTHQTSKIFAETAKVNVLRGYLKTQELAKITRLEGGVVEAKTAEVAQMIGGEIKAMRVDVGLLASNAKIFAVSEIVIDKMVGENNKLVIDASKIDAYHNEIVSLEEEAEVLKKEIEKLEEDLARKVELKQKSEPTIATLKQKILQETKKGIKPKPAFIAKIKQFQKLIEAIEAVRKKRDERKGQLHNIKQKLLTFQEMVVNAKIVNHGEWKDYTSVEFHLLYPQITLEYTPVPGAKNQQIYLRKAGEEDGYEIAVKEADA
ncbi:flagellar assembly protein A [Hydrogenimonas cancrithermarum]|uniref:Flagellar Assembly Protein A N-terminal region domain-containing protein n=1 Tax=Hydrogenimonas cancrithermarum TaxID=2993563 RepID=A0ABM8FHW2_9BACT|nr:flagellar assembly protein A [Hydrogenimonas cancrithermarum]BDY11867.1 hypothetical protein HCR_01790 [Hydrogenimonas cancrithermarum]